MEDVFASLQEFPWEDIPAEDRIESVAPPMCEEIRKSISFALIGKPKPPRTQEHCDNMAKAFSRTYKLTFADGRELIITNMKKFCRESKYHAPHLRGVMKGLRGRHFDIVAVEKLAATP